MAEEPAVAMDEPPPPAEEGGMSVCQEEAKPAVPSVSQGALPPTPPGTMAFAVTCPGDVTPGGPMAVPPWGAKYGLASRYPSEGGCGVRASAGREGGVTRVCVGCVDWIVGARGWFASLNCQAVP